MDPTGYVSEGLSLLNLVDKAKNVTLYKQLGDYIGKVEQLQKEKDILATKVFDLAEQLRFKGNLEYIAGHTFVHGLDQEICPRCADVDHKPVRLQDMNIDGRGMRATCPECKTAIGRMAPPISRLQADKAAERAAAS